VYANEKCNGVNLLLTDRNALDGPELGIEVAAALHHLYPDKYKVEGLDTLTVNRSSVDAIAAGEDPRRIAEEWRDGLETFEAVRARYLIY
jgi:uncharacterized protein YbbC (DUF1343 family)